MNRVQNYAGQSGKIGAGCIISIIVVVLLVIGGMTFMFFKGMDMAAEEVRKAVQDDPVIQQHLGEITEIDLNLSATGQAPENQNKGEGDKHSFLVLDVVGTKGEGTLTVKMVQSGEAMTFSDGKLKMADGQTYDLELPAADAPKQDSPEKDEPKKDAPAEKGEPAGVGK